MRAPNVFVLLLMASCGARTELSLDRQNTGSTESGASSGGAASGDAASDATAGAGAGGTSAANSTSAGGGALVACANLESNGPLTALPSLGPGTSDNTRFHWLDKTRMAVVHRPFDNVLGLRIGSTTIDWTSGWPAGNAAPVELVATADESFAIDRAENPLIGLLAPRVGLPGVWFGEVDPAVGGWSPSLPVDLTADRATFVRRSVFGEYFLGTSAPGTSPNGSTQFRASFFDGTKLRGPYNAGCSAVPILADALPVPNGWLLARTAPATPASCSPLAPAPAEQSISIDLIANGMPLVGGEVPFGGKTSQLILVPRAEGAWLLYWSDAITLQALSLDGFGKILGVVKVATLTENSFAFAADKLDDGLVVVLFDAPSEGPTALRVLVLDGQGAPLSSVSIANPPKLTTPPQVAFDPNTRQVLVGFSGIANAVQSVYLARFACSGS
jgi:hypothetical protein